MLSVSVKLSCVHGLCYCVASINNCLFKSVSSTFTNNLHKITQMHVTIQVVKKTDDAGWVPYS